MKSDRDSLVFFETCDVWNPDAFGPASWSLPFGPEPVLRGVSWRWEPGEIWAFLGANGSGKSVLAAAVAGRCTVRPGSAEEFYSRFSASGLKIEFLSFEEQEKALLYAETFDESDFVEGGRHPGLLVEEYLGSMTAWPVFLKSLWNELGMPPLIRRGLKYLSTGELRKVVLFHALSRKPDLLVCDELLEGLDSQAREEIGRLFRSLGEAASGGGGTSLLFLCDREEHVPEVATHMLRMDSGRVISAGPYAGRSGTSPVHPAPSVTGTVPASGPEVVRLENIRVAWEDKVVFNGFTFSLHEGEHCLIRGPNGCGKSTLVKLLTGEHPQVFVNRVEVCGIRRGSGESRRDILLKTGLVSHELHRAFLRLGDISLEEVVLSGFFSTIGLYEPAGEVHRKAAREAILLCGLEASARAAFPDLSWGLQRLALAARAFVRRPPLLILDEPCHGLDGNHRGRFLEITDTLAESAAASGDPLTIVHVTHDPTERLSCIRAELVFHPDGWDEAGQPRYRTEFLSKS